MAAIGAPSSVRAGDRRPVLDLLGDVVGAPLKKQIWGGVFGDLQDKYNSCGLSADKPDYDKMPGQRL